MPAHADAILEEANGRFSLRFERDLPHSPDKVWEALTVKDELGAWHPTPFNFEPEVGATITFDPPEGMEFGDGEVLAYEPPRVFAYTWDSDELRWSLEPAGEGTRLVLIHTFDDRFKAARDASGWDVCLEQLGKHLAGEEAESSRDPENPPSGWAELNERYQERFGIAPEDATPVPGSD